MSPKNWSVNLMLFEKWTEGRMMPLCLPNCILQLPPVWNLDSTLPFLFQKCKCPLSFFAKGMNVNSCSVREVGHYSQWRLWFSKNLTSQKAEHSRMKAGAQRYSTDLRVMSQLKKEPPKRNLTMALERKPFPATVWESWQCCSSSVRL